jgi:DNA sulfur modification protein DndE
MSFNRIKICAEATQRLGILKGRTGMTPNILCRLALCLSLNEPGLPDQNNFDERGQEFNRFTLTGEWDQLFIAVLKERMIQDGLDPSSDLLESFRSHLNRGVPILYNRVKTLTDLQELLPPEGMKPSEMK